jgi:hypothetical protein
MYPPELGRVVAGWRLIPLVFYCALSPFWEESALKM